MKEYSDDELDIKIGRFLDKKHIEHFSKLNIPPINISKADLLVWNKPLLLKSLDTTRKKQIYQPSF